MYCGEEAGALRRACRKYVNSSASMLPAPLLSTAPNARRAVRGSANEGLAGEDGEEREH